jgi:hypothetical protein
VLAALQTALIVILDRTQLQAEEEVQIVKAQTETLAGVGEVLQTRNHLLVFIPPQVLEI